MGLQPYWEWMKFMNNEGWLLKERNQLNLNEVDEVNEAMPP